MSNIFRLKRGNVKAFIVDKNFNNNATLLNAYVNMKAICETLHHIDKTFKRNKRKIEIVSFWNNEYYWNNNSYFEKMRDTIETYCKKWDAIVTYVKTEDEWESKEYGKFYKEVKKAVYAKIDEVDK